MTIHAEKGDPIPGLHSGRAQPARQPGRAISELRVAKSLFLANHRRLVWKLLFRIPEEADGRERKVHAQRLPTRQSALRPRQEHGQ
jgi:hypothetical protein